MNATKPARISQSWPLFEQARHFELGRLLNCAVIDAVPPTEVGHLGLLHSGCWECDLTDDSLFWSGGVYDLFGLPRGSRMTRNEAVGFYCEESRAAMERLRGHAIEQKRGFTLDVQIRPAVGERRWMRIIGVPVLEGNRATRLHGLKLII